MRAKHVRIQLVDIKEIPATKRWGRPRILYKLNNRFWSDYKEWVSRSEHVSRFLRLPLPIESMLKIWEKSKE